MNGVLIRVLSGVSLIQFMSNLNLVNLDFLKI